MLKHKAACANVGIEPGSMVNGMTMRGKIIVVPPLPGTGEIDDVQRMARGEPRLRVMPELAGPIDEALFD